MNKKHNVSNNADSDFRFGFAWVLTYLAAVCFGFGASNFEFKVWMDGQPK